MARVTVEDCIEKIPNRFDLVLTAAQRAKNISSGDVITVDRDNDKNPVVALREIADETISVEEVNESLIKSLQRISQREEEQTTIDEAASLAQDDMNAFTGAFGDDAADNEGMQLAEGSGDAAVEADNAGDIGSFGDIDATALEEDS